jgi:hypothetical protein
MIDKQFIVERQGKQFVLYAGLLDLAHKQGLKAVRTRLLQVPSDENGQTAICAADVETERGTFSGIGDASPANVARAMLTCTIRLAETRAKARALRDAVNVGVAAFEELGDVDTAEASESRVLSPNVGANSERPTSTNVGRSSTPTPIRSTGADPRATLAQRAMIERLAGQLRRTIDVERLTKPQASALIDSLQWEVQAGSGLPPGAPPKDPRPGALPSPAVENTRQGAARD